MGSKWILRGRAVRYCIPKATVAGFRHVRSAVTEFNHGLFHRRESK